VRSVRLAFLLFLAAGAAFAQSEGIAEFQGSVHTEKDKTIPSHGKVYMTSAAVRVEWETDLREMKKDRAEKGAAGMPDTFQMTMIQKVSEPGQMYAINDKNKTYAIEKTDLRDTGKSDRKWKVERQGRDKVAGFSCEKATLTSEDGDQNEVCIVTDWKINSAWLRAWNRREEQASPLQALKDAGITGFPVRWTFRHKGGKESWSSMELVRFTKQSVPGSLFEIPPGYRKVDSLFETAMTPEQEQKMREARQKMKEAMENMTPEQRKQYEEMMKRYAPTPHD
jgi:hypothetical protein